MALAYRLRVAVARLPLGTPRAFHAAPPAASPPTAATAATPPTAVTTWLMSRLTQIETEASLRMEALHAESREMKKKLDEARYEHQLSLMEARRLAATTAAEIALAGGVFVAGSLFLVKDYVV